MALVAAAVMAYAHRLRQRKREVERKLAEIEEEHALRPTLVADAMRQVETEFYQSDYYIALRRRIETGGNLSPQEWQELEQRLKSVYPRFSSSLYGLFNLSPSEYQMCMLLKVRTVASTRKFSARKGVEKIGMSSFSHSNSFCAYYQQVIRGLQTFCKLFFMLISKCQPIANP